MLPARQMRLELIAGAVCWAVAPLLAYFLLQPHLIGLPLLLMILVSVTLAHSLVIALLRFALSN